MSEPAPPLKIAYLTGEYPKVSHTFILREVEALRALGADVSTCTVREPAAEQRAGADEAAAHATTYRLLAAAKNPFTLLAAHAAALLRTPRGYFAALALALRTGGPGPIGILYQLFYFAEAGVLARHLRKAGVDHLHNHFGNSSCSVAMLTSALSGIPFSFTLHGPSIFFEPRRWRIDEKIARARLVACISHFCRSQAMLFSDQADWPKLKIVHCGVAPDAYAPTAGGGGFVFVGRLAAVKGVAMLLDAFARLAADHPDARLTLIGDGAERMALERKAADLGLSGQVEFCGYLSQPEVAARLAGADVFVLPSFAEGVPVALMEAMASRLPVIAPRVGGVQELVEDGRSGFVVAPGDDAMLADRMARLISDPDLRRSMGADGRAMIETGFVGAREAGWLLELIRGAHDSALPVGIRPGR